MSIEISNYRSFSHRHIGPTNDEIQQMLQELKVSDLEQLINETIPPDIRLEQPLNLPEAQSEYDFLNSFSSLMKKNRVFRSFIGLGYYNCYLPPVIQRNILENPGWYTAYTPYQAEIAQGRLEALVNFQTMVCDLTNMDIANASLLDEGTAAAEAMSMLFSLRKAGKQGTRFFVHDKIFPHTLDILRTRSQPLGIELVTGPMLDFEDDPSAYFGCILQYPDFEGNVVDFEDLIKSAHQHDVLTVVAADLLSLTLLKAPGTMGADVVVGTTQRFGVPMGYGGPHAAYFATREIFKRQIPGRIIGVSIDKNGHQAYRMALQTREQHIRREKATSNICTAQVLLAVIAGMYAVYHGPEGLKAIASRIHGLAVILARGLRQLGFKIVNQYYFDTLTIEIPNSALLESIKVLALLNECNFRYDGDQSIGFSLDETTKLDDVELILSIFAKATQQESRINVKELPDGLDYCWPSHLNRQTRYLTHPVFRSYQTEHQMLRYLKKLENKDLSLVHSMISLGSCTMKLNATAEMMPVTWPELANIHPFAPRDQALGYREMFTELEAWLSTITGFDATSLQPNSGAQGEFAGLMVIRAYHRHNNHNERDIALIPSSAHGTNPASAVMAGMQVVIVKCDELGNIDIQDLTDKVALYGTRISALMVTYPSTHGVFEERIKEICGIVHQAGGQVYMDGANMNAQVGLTSPAEIGADICHLNLHKTFCIPHGGGGPGMGPICVAAHLKPFLPGNPIINMGPEKAITAISAAPWGSASILAISYAYIALMGGKGLSRATELAILNANYVLQKLKMSYEILYTGKSGRCAHELIVDCRSFKVAGIEVEDIAKRLMDYGFHAPTVSFPVAGTMMIEPTESESKVELDRFCQAMLAIRQEIRDIEEGRADPVNNLLKNAPHTADAVLTDDWEFPYSRKQAVYPLPFVKESKFWPTVSRIDSAYGDRNLVCSCIPLEEYADLGS